MEVAEASGEKAKADKTSVDMKIFPNIQVLQDTECDQHKIIPHTVEGL